MRAISGRMAPLHLVLRDAAAQAPELARGETDDVGDPIAPWAARQLSSDHVAWLARLPYPVTLNVEGFGDLVFCARTHAGKTHARNERRHH